MQLLVALALAACVWSGISGTAMAEPVATDARLGEHPEHTRFVLDLSEPVEYRLFNLADPYRIVLELPAMSWRLPRQAGLSGAGLVRSYRYGLFGHSRSRVVLELNDPAKVQADFIMPPEEGKPARLVLDLVPVSKAEFLETAGWPDDGDTPTAQAEPEEVPEGSAPVGQGDGRFIIALDAGHGGPDPGATGTGGTLEKDVVLKATLALRDELERRGDYTVVLIREDDTFLNKKDRVRAARAARADLFISLHADTVSNAAIHGASVYTLSESASDVEAAELAESQNASDIIAGVDLSGEGDDVNSILIDLAQRETKNRSTIFAQLLLPELDAQTGLLTQPLRSAGFRVLKAPDVPSVLIELGFLSNPTDESRLTDDAWRADMASAIANAVDTYYARMSSVAQSGGESLSAH
ncbi:MAG: N-acetylmuramoyl-L-alanine amidase [Micropepsaceae bacterium]